MRNRLLVACCLAMALALALALTWACSGEDPTDNGCPRITHVGDASWQGDDLHVGIWLRDVDEDPVDLTVTRADGTQVEQVFGHGKVGLSSSADSKGAPHELVLKGDDIEGSPTLTFVPEDVAGGRGDPVKFQIPAKDR